MEPPPMILPKGIVFNIDRVYKEVASYAVVPPEKIYEYWHVYTTTFGKLKDPTANRLENFWWHVMGSDRRLLAGSTLARLFEQISNGPTFVPLRGPPNRYEGPSVPAIPMNHDASQLLNKAPSRQDSGGDELSRKIQLPKAIPSSSSKPPPSHPILKKPRGPSSSGPRPTARFVSPPGSDVEDDTKESEADSSASAQGTTASQSKQTNLATKERHKKITSSLSKKKTAAFVASSSSKRRPAMPRRQSSQSSATGSEVGSREERSSLSARYLGAQRAVSPIAEKPSNGVVTKSKDAGNRLSTKAAGKRPAVTTATSSTLGGKQTAAALTQEQPVVEQASSPEIQLLAENPRGKPEGSVRETKRPGEGEMGPAWIKNNAHTRARPETRAPAMARSRSDIGDFQLGSREIKSGRRVPPQGLLSTSTTTTSTVAAQGTIIESDENASARAVASAMQEDMPETGLRRSGSAVTLTPTAPSNTATVPLGRSKSQLTLLLERQGEKKPRR